MPDVIDIYHGSVNVVDKPVFGEGKLFNDYGRGFYCTEHIELAKEWACAADSMIEKGGAEQNYRAGGGV